MTFTTRARTRTTTKTTATSSTRAPVKDKMSRLAAAPVLARSRKSPSLAVPPRSPPQRQDDTDESQLSDWEAELHDASKADRERAQLEKELEEAKEEQKRCKAKGVDVPQAVKDVLARHRKTKKPAQLRADQHAVVALARDAAHGSRPFGAKGKGRASSVDLDDALGITRPTLDRNSKRFEVAKRTGLLSEEADLDLAGAEEVYRGAEGYEDDPQEVRKHLARRWIDRKHPERMSAARKAMEEKYNPLIKLLRIPITVVEVDKNTDAVSERKQVRDATKLLHTDDEQSSSDSTDWDSDGMGAYGGRIQFKPRPILPVKPDEKPRTVAPVSVKSLPVRTTVKKEESYTIILIDSEEEAEPDTEDDDGSPPPKPAKTAFARVDATTMVHPGASAQPKSEVADHDEEDAEPDTEDDDEPSLRPSSLTKGGSPHSLAHQVESEPFPNRASSPGSGTQSQRRSSQSQSGISALGAQSASDDMLADEIDEEEEDDLSRAVRHRSEREQHARRQQEEEERAQQEETRARRAQEQLAARRRAAQAMVAELRRKKSEKKASALGGVGKGRESDDELDGGPIDADEELMVMDVDAGRVQYPKPPARKTRPRFPILDAAQERTGPHRLSADEADSAYIPAPINKFLRQYQREGVEFLYGQYKQGIGGVLGDDMGLGKTIQVIAFLSAVMGKTGLRKVDRDRRRKAVQDLTPGDQDFKPSKIAPTCLVIAPASVVYNWARELETWGYFDVGVYAGDQKDKVLRQFDRGLLDIVITGYEAVRLNIGDVSQRDFTIVIADEAHRLKNPTSGTTEAMHRFPARLRYGMTGTAVQNRLGELWCLLHWTVPGRVGTFAQWRDLVTRPIGYAQQADASQEILATGRARASALVGTLLPKFFWRRTKAEVKLQLPPKTDHIVLCPLTSLQLEVYGRLLQLEDVHDMVTADQPCTCGRLDEENRPFKKGNCCKQDWAKLIFKYIVLFQKVANHLGLIYPDHLEQNTNPEKYQQDKEWMRAAFPDDYQERRTTATALLDPELCGKWKILRELLRVWYERNDKVLIFSASLKVLAFLEEFMSQTRYEYLVLDGSTPQDDRLPLVDEFNDPDSDKFCFLISTKAGGVGLNLTAANRVVIFDPNWNPAHDLQAMDRAYRFGQKREVDVYRLIGAGTLEELVYNRQQYKRALASVAYEANAERRLFTGIQDEGKECAGELFGVKNMFKLHSNSSLTEKSIFRADMDEIEFALRNDTLLDLDANENQPAAEEIAKQVVGRTEAAAQPKAPSLVGPARDEARKDEQDKISSILSGAVRVESDAVLGGSSIEALRARQAVRAQLAHKNQRRSTETSASETDDGPKSSNARRRSESARVEKKTSKRPQCAQPAALDWNDVIMRRKRPSSEAQSSPKRVKRESSSEPSLMGILANQGLPEDVSPDEVIACSGYTGSRGSRKLVMELERLDTAGKRALLRSLIAKWREVDAAA